MGPEKPTPTVRLKVVVVVPTFMSRSLRPTDSCSSSGRVPAPKEILLAKISVSSIEVEPHVYSLATKAEQSTSRRGAESSVYISL